MDYITDLMVQKQDTCQHWNWFDLYGDPAKKAPESVWNRLMFEARLMNEEAVATARGAWERPTGETVEERAAATLELMRAGVPLIYKPVLIVSDLLAEPDLLERRDDLESDLGTWHYAALDIRGGEKVTEAMKNRAAFYGELLADLQGQRPANGCVLTVDGSQFAFALDELEHRVHDLLEDIDRMRTTGECPEPHLAAACKQSPWFKECIHLAEATDDVALLYNVKRRALKRFREAGLNTVAAVAEADLKQFVGTGHDMTTDNLERIHLQAEALIAREHYHRRPYVMGAPATEVYFDIEADGLRGNFDYLFGFLVRDAAGVRFEKFAAERPEDQEQMWRDVLKWFGQLPTDTVIYHYGDHERHALAVLESRYGGAKTLTRVRAMLRDLNEIMKDCLVFPLYFYGLKEIGGYVGYKREAEIAHGALSVEYYERWLAEQDRTLLDAIIHYNREDCEATMALRDWLVDEQGRQA